MKEHIERWNRILAGADNSALVGIIDAVLGDAMQADKSEEGSPMHLALTGLHLTIIELEKRVLK